MFLSTHGETFGFKHPKINEILPEDVEISDDIYNKFFELQGKGKKFIIKNKYGQTFEEIFEEVK